MSNEVQDRLVFSQSDVAVVGTIKRIPVSVVDVKSLTNLRTQDSTALVNELQRQLDISRSGQSTFPIASSEDLTSFRRRAIRLLVKLSRHYNTFPAVFLIEGIRCSQKLDPISRGGFADIFQGTIGDVMVALKRLRAYGSEGDRKRIQDMLGEEAILWRQLDHPHVLPLLGIDNTTFAPLYCIVTPWMENGNLLDFLEKNPSTPSQIKRWLVEAAKGLQYLHEQGIVHGDLRAANVLVNDVHRACLADFGLAHMSSFASTAVNTPASLTNARWLAPELLAEDESTATMKGDVFAFGRVCLEAYTLRVPFWYIQLDAVVIRKIQDGEDVRRPTFGETGFQGLSDRMWGILQRLWEKEPSERPSITACISLLEPDTEERSLVHPMVHPLMLKSSLPEHSHASGAHPEPSAASAVGTSTDSRMSDSQAATPRNAAVETAIRRLGNLLAATPDTRQIVNEALDIRQRPLTSFEPDHAAEDMTSMAQGSHDRAYLLKGFTQSFARFWNALSPFRQPYSYHLSLLEDFVKNHGLSVFFPPGSSFLHELATQAIELSLDPTTDLGSPKNLPKLLRLSLYQPIIYCDDSQSMDQKDGTRLSRFDKLRVLLTRIARISTKLAPDKLFIRVCFVNAATSVTANSADRIASFMENVLPSYNTTLKLGLGFHTNVAPRIYNDQGTVKGSLRPMLVCTITNGEPLGEDRDAFKLNLYQCYAKLCDTRYHPNVVHFSISQMGNNPDAERYLNKLRADATLQHILHVTPDRLETKYDELRKSERALEAWLLDILTQPLMKAGN